MNIEKTRTCSNAILGRLLADYLVLGVSNSVGVYREGGLALGQAGAVVDLADSSLPSTFPDKILQYCGGRN